MDKPRTVLNKEGCNDLTADAGLIPFSDSPGGLCAVCQQLDFESLTVAGCRACANDGPESYHFHVGTLEQVSNKKDVCRGCQIILAVAKSYGIVEEEYEKSLVQVGSDAFGLLLLEEYQITAEGSVRAPTEHWISQVHFIDVQITTSMDGARSVGTIVRMFDPDAEQSRSGCQGEWSQFEALKGGRAVGPEVSLHLVKEWINLCASTHPMCRDHATVAAAPIPDTIPITNTEPRSPIHTSEPSIRLIDVQEQRIVQASLSHRFLALSYVWGDTPGLLTKERLQLFSLPGGLAPSAVTIPRTISDAISFTRSIGERYLWVDSLCIIQDSDADKNHQLPLMASIYSSAVLVLIVAPEASPDTPDDANTGIPRLRNTDSLPNNHDSNNSKHHHCQTIETINSTQFVTLFPDLSHILNRTTWNTRGWTFQEAILARRSLIFTSYQVYFCCKTANWREDMASESSESVIIEVNNAGTRSSSLSSSSDGGGGGISYLFSGPTRIHTCRNRMYTGQVEHFSSRRFGNEGDVFWAVVGVLRRFQTTTMGIDTPHELEIAAQRNSEIGAGVFPKGFIWAMPYESLDVALLWDVIRKKQACATCRCILKEQVRWRRRPHVVEVDVKSSPSPNGREYHSEDGGEEGAGRGILGRKRFALKYPSWSWMSTTEALRFVDGCGDSIVSEVRWHDPILLGSEESFPYMASVLTEYVGMDDSGVSEKDGNVAVEYYKELRRASAAWRGAMDYGLLQFTAQTAKLTVSRMAEHEEKKADVGENGGRVSPEDPSDEWVECVVQHPDGDKTLAKVTIPQEFLSSRSERIGEFILLSSKADEGESDERCLQSQRFGNVRHVVGCKHLKSHNLMLVDWKGDIAYRQAICSVAVEAWENIVTTERKIVLG